jgi:hypothetical protein
MKNVEIREDARHTQHHKSAYLHIINAGRRNGENGKTFKECRKCMKIIIFYNKERDYQPSLASWMLAFLRWHLAAPAKRSRGCM